MTAEADKSHTRGWQVLSMLALFACGALIVARTVQAELGETTLRLGRGLGEFSQFAGPTTRVVFNGQEITFHVRTVPASVKDVVDDFVRVCSRDARGVSDELASRLGAADAVQASSLIQRALVLRDRRGDEGTALCFAGLSDQGLAGLAERFKRFAASMDLSELGAARYLYARKIAAGTQLLMVAADGPLQLDRLLPLDDRDAQGAEPIAGARPRDAVRLISAHAANLPYAVTTYRSKLAPAPLLEDYAKQATARGYAPVDLDQISERPLTAALASRAEFRVLRGAEATLIATAIPDAGGSRLSIVQLLGAGVPRMAAMR